MSAYIIRFFFTATAFLLSADSKIRVLLNNICWFNSLSDLTTEEKRLNKGEEEEIIANWVQLWRCAGKLCRRRASPAAPSAKARHSTRCPVRLRSHKRDELAFLFRTSSLHQLVMCHHAGGEAGDHAFPLLPLTAKHNAPFRHCAFLLPEPDPIRSGYVYCLCRSLSDRRRPYLYGG